MSFYFAYDQDWRFIAMLLADPSLDGGSQYNASGDINPDGALLADRQHHPRPRRSGQG